MKRLLATLAVATVAIGLSQVWAQEGPPASEAGEEHQWLKRFVGEWTTTAEATAAPGAEPMQCQGSAKARMLGDLWLVNEVKSNMAGISVDAVQTIGYDPEKEKYVGSWIDSMFNHKWEYEGTVDESGDKLTLEAEGPNMMTGEGTTKYRDSYEFKSKDEILATSSAQDENGEWVTFMTGTMTRVK